MVYDEDGKGLHGVLCCMIACACVCYGLVGCAMACFVCFLVVTHE